MERAEYPPPFPLLVAFALATPTRSALIAATPRAAWGAFCASSCFPAAWIAWFWRWLIALAGSHSTHEATACQGLAALLDLADHASDQRRDQFTIPIPTG